MKETEVTVQCLDTLEKIISHLKSKGWIMSENFQLNDWYFSKHDLKTLHSMTYQNLISNSFLVRQIIENQENTIKMIYKSKEFDNNGNVISETKTNTMVNNLNNALKIFEQSGLTMWQSTKNNSYVFVKDNVEVVVQDITGLGTFIEVEEDKSIEHLSDNEKFSYLTKLVNSLGLKLGADYSCKKVFMQFKNSLNNTENDSI